MVLLCFGAVDAGRGAENGPSGLAGRAQTWPAPPIFHGAPGGNGRYFEWYEYFGEHRLEAGRQLELSFVIIPFANSGYGATDVVLDTDGGVAFVALNFHRGLLNQQLAYRPSDWNSVRALLDFSSQSYSLTLNGATAGPFRFLQPSESVQAFHVYYSGFGRLGWFDSVVLSGGDEILLRVDFDGNLPGSQSLCEGCILEPARPGDDTIPPCCTNTIRPPSRQDGLAGRAETILTGIGASEQYFEWYQPFGAHQFDSGGQVDMSFYILAFAGAGAGGTLVGLDDGEGATFFSMHFKNGLVNGQLAYDPTNWNAVKASLDFAAQSYELVVNGAGVKSIPFGFPSTSMRAFRVNYLNPGLTPAVAWFDSVTLTSGPESLLSIDFDRTRPSTQNLCEACNMTAEDPVPTGPSQIAERPRLIVQKVAGGIELSWAYSSTTPRLQVSDSLAGPWQEVLEPSRSEGDSSVVRIQSPPAPAFFRLIAPRNP
jgi:hypothetical protein